MISKPALAFLCLPVLLLQGCADLTPKTQSNFIGNIKTVDTVANQPAATLKKTVFPRENEFKYILYHPHFQKGKRYRMILALHGAREQAENYIEIWKATALKNNTIIVAPQLGPGLFLFNSKQDPSLFFDFTDYLKNKYPVDEKQIFIAGSSMGAATGTFLIQHRPDYWRGAIFVASIGFPTCFPGKSAEKITNFKDFPPILYVMGMQDKVNFKPVLEGREFLLKQGVHVQLYSYENAGHEHRPEWNDRIFEWIERVELNTGTS